MRARLEVGVLWIKSLVSGVPHGEAKLVSFVRANCGVHREILGFRWSKGDRIKWVSCNIVTALGFGVQSVVRCQWSVVEDPEVGGGSESPLRTRRGGRATGKSEIRTTKSETNSKHED